MILHYISSYSKEQLEERNTIIQSQKTVSKYLCADIVNTLIHLFDEKHNADSAEYQKITKMIKDERARHGLDNSTVTITSELHYGYNNTDPILFLGIRKNGVEFIHFTLHLAVKKLDPK